MNRAALFFLSLSLAVRGLSQDALSLSDIAFLGQSLPHASLTAPTFIRAGTNTSSSASTLTISAFSVTGSNPYLLVMEANNSSITARTCTGVTANGVAMAILVQTNFAAHGNCYIWGLANPTTGDVVAALSGVANSGMTVYAILLNGSAASTGSAANFSSSSRSSVSVAPTSTATDLVVDFLPASTGWTAGGSQVTVATASTGVAGGASTLAGAAGTTTMSWSTGASAVGSQLAVSMSGM